MTGIVLFTGHMFSVYSFWADLLFNILWLSFIFNCLNAGIASCLGDKLMVPDLTNRDYEYCWWFLLSPVWFNMFGRSRLMRPATWLAPSQWETSLQSNAVSHWLGAILKSALLTSFCCGELYQVTTEFALKCDFRWVIINFINVETFCKSSPDPSQALPRHYLIIHLTNRQQHYGCQEV